MQRNKQAGTSQPQFATNPQNNSQRAAVADPTQQQQLNMQQQQQPLKKQLAALLQSNRDGSLAAKVLLSSGKKKKTKTSFIKKGKSSKDNSQSHRSSLHTGSSQQENQLSPLERSLDFPIEINNNDLNLSTSHRAMQLAGKRRDYQMLQSLHTEHDLAMVTFQQKPQQSMNNMHVHLGSIVTVGQIDDIQEDGIQKLQMEVEAQHRLAVNQDARSGQGDEEMRNREIVNDELVDDDDDCEFVKNLISDGDGSQIDDNEHNQDMFSNGMSPKQLTGTFQRQSLTGASRHAFDEVDELHDPSDEQEHDDEEQTNTGFATIVQKNNSQVYVNNPLQKSSIHNIVNSTEQQTAYNPFDHQRGVPMNQIQRRKTTVEFNREISFDQLDSSEHQARQPAGAVLALNQQRSTNTREQSASEITAMDILQLQTAGAGESDMAEHVMVTNPAFLGGENFSNSVHSKRLSMKSHFQGRNSMISQKESGQNSSQDQNHQRMKTFAAAHQSGLSVDSDYVRSSEPRSKITQNELASEDQAVAKQQMRLSALLVHGNQQQNLQLEPISIPISPNSIINEEHYNSSAVDGADDSESANQRNTVSNKSIKIAPKPKVNKVAKLIVKTRPEKISSSKSKSQRAQTLLSYQRKPLGDRPASSFGMHGSANMQHSDRVTESRPVSKQTIFSNAKRGQSKPKKISTLQQLSTPVLSSNKKSSRNSPTDSQHLSRNNSKLRQSTETSLNRNKRVQKQDSQLQQSLSRSRTNEDLKAMQQTKSQGITVSTTENKEFRVVTSDEEEQKGVNEVHFDEFDPTRKGSMIQPASPNSVNSPNFLPDLKIEDLKAAGAELQSQQQPARKQAQGLLKRDQDSNRSPLRSVNQMNPRRAFEIAQSQQSSKVFERLQNMKSQQQQFKATRRCQDFDRMNMSESQAIRKRSNTTTSSQRPRKNPDKRNRVRIQTNNQVQSRVVEAISAVLHKKELLETSMKNMVNAFKDITKPKMKPLRLLTSSDIRHIMRELKLVRQVSLPPNNVRLSHSSSNMSQHAQNTQPFLEQETLIDQIQALFFTNQVQQIDYIHMQDFFVILMSDTVEQEKKIVIIQKIIQESIQTSKQGGKQDSPVKLASQKLFQLTQTNQTSSIQTPQISFRQSEQSQKQSSDQQQEQSESELHQPEQAEQEEEIFEIKQQMYIAQLERQLIQQMLAQYDKLCSFSEAGPNASGYNTRKKDRSMSQNMLRSSSSNYIRKHSNNNFDAGSSPKAMSSHSTSFLREQQFLAKNPVRTHLEDGTQHKRETNNHGRPVAGSLKQELEIAIGTAARNSQMTPSVRFHSPNHHSQGNTTQNEDVIDESALEKFKFDEQGEDCNVVIEDDDNGSFMPLSHNDIGSFGGGSSPRDEQEERHSAGDEDDVDDHSSDHNIPSRHQSQSPMWINHTDGSSSQERLNSEELDDDDDEEESSPIKNMRAVGHIGAISIGSNSIKGRTEHGSSASITRRSNSLAKNMSSFLMTRQGPNFSQASKSLIGSISNIASYRPASFNSQFNELSDTERDHPRQGQTAQRTSNINDLAFAINDPTRSLPAASHSAYPGPKARPHSTIADNANSAFPQSQSFKQLILPQDTIDGRQINSSQTYSQMPQNSLFARHSSQETLTQPPHPYNDIALTQQKALNKMTSSHSNLLQQMPADMKQPMHKKTNFGGHKNRMKDYFRSEDFDVMNDSGIQNRRSMHSTIGVNDWRGAQQQQQLPFATPANSSQNYGAQTTGRLPQTSGITRNQKYFQQTQAPDSHQAASMGRQPAGVAPAVHQPSFRSGLAHRAGGGAGPTSSTTRKDGWKDEANLRYQIDIQISPKKMLIVKIYEGDKAEDILANLTSNKDLELDEEDIINIERVVRHHTTH